MRAQGTATTAIALAVAVAALAAAGCGAETMSAQEFVDSVREQGVEVELGDELLTDDPNKELYGLELKPLAGAGLDAGEHGDVHAGGSIAAYDDADGADGGFQACEVAADLLCYRAANIVIVLESGGIEAQRLGVAIQKLGD